MNKKKYNRADHVDKIIQSYEKTGNYMKTSVEVELKPYSVLSILKKEGEYDISEEVEKDAFYSPIINDCVSNGGTLVDLSKKYGVSPAMISKAIKESDRDIKIKKYNEPIFKLNDSYFESIDSSDKAYFLGLLATDGSIQDNSSGTIRNIVKLDLNREDKPILESMKMHIESNRPVYDYKTGNISRLIVNSEKMVQDLLVHGVMNRKTFKLCFPEIDEELNYHYLRGYFDGDGCITRNNNTGAWSLSFIGTVDVIDNIKKILGIEHLSTNQRFPEREQCNETLNIGGNLQIEKILRKLYKDSDETVRMSRKYNRYLELKKQNRKIKIKTNTINKQSSICVNM